MIKCSNCGQENRPGMLFCERCSYSLEDSGASLANPTVPTRSLLNDLDEISAKATWGSARFGDNSTIVVQIRNINEPIRIRPKSKVIFGRTDESSTVIPDVDFAPFGGLEKGVSRQHAILEITEETLMLFDAGSSNGTFLNGQRLSPNQPRILRDGDEVRLGKMVTHIYFE